MLEWINAVLSWLGGLATRMFRQSPGMELFQMLQDEVKRLRIGLEVCEDRHHEKDVIMQSLHREVWELHNLINEIKGWEMVGHVECDRHGKIIYADVAFATLSEYTVTELPSMYVSQLVPYSYRGEHARKFAAVVSDSKIVLNKGPIKGAILRRSGVEIPVTINLSTWTVGNEVRFGAEFRKRELDHYPMDFGSRQEMQAKARTLREGGDESCQPN